MKEKIAFWYKYKIWTEQMVLDALTKGILTEKEVAEILSQ